MMENRPHFKPGGIKYTKGYRRKLFFLNLIKITFIMIGIAISILIVYIYVKQPVKYITGEEYVFAKPHYKLLEPGDEIIVVETENYNMFTPLIRFAIPQVTHKAKIIAGPYGKIKNINDEFYVVYRNQEHLVNLSELRENEYLDEEYIARPVDIYGDYIEGYDLIIDKTKILGKTL